MPPVFSISPSLRPNQPKLVSPHLTPHSWGGTVVFDESKGELHPGTASPGTYVDALLQVYTFGASCKQRITTPAVLKIRDRIPYVSQKVKNSHSQCVSVPVTQTSYFSYGFFTLYVLHLKSTCWQPYVPSGLSLGSYNLAMRNDMHSCVNVNHFINIPIN